MEMGAKILVVEDEGIEALSLQQKLKARGYNVPEIVYTGEDAVKKAAQISPDLVLMDIMLHGEMDGIAAAEKIHARFDIPIIYITAYADEDTLKRAKITEPYGYLVKPFKERELIVSIEMALYKHKVERELKESRRLLETTLKSIGDGVIATDKTGLITFMNPIAERLIGWKQEEVLNKELMEVFKIINRDTRKPAENPATTTLEGFTTDFINILLIIKGGKKIPIEFSAAPIKDDNGNSLGAILVFREVTEREKMQAALRESEQRWATTLASIGDAVISTDAEGHIIFMNAVAEALTGWTLAEAFTKPVAEVFDIINEYTRREADNPVARVLREGTIVGLANHTVLVRKDGTEVPIDDSGAPIRDRDGRTMGVVLVFRDITEHKRAEEELRKAHDELELRVQDRTAELEEANVELEAEIEERKKAERETQEAHKYAETIVETLRESLVVLDGKLKVKKANQTFYNTFNVAPEETLGKLIYELGNHQWDIPELRKLLEEIIPKNSQLNDFEVNHEFPSIGRKTMRLNARRIYQEEIGIKGILLAIEDITEHKRAEEQIREQAALLDEAHDTIILRDLEHRIIYWNKGAERMYGWSANEAIGKNAIELLYKDKSASPQLIEAKKRIIERGEWTGELNQLTRDGEDIIVESRWTLIRDDKETPKSILTINIDITEKKKLESQLLHAQRMESIGTLAGGIAHDLNNVLTPMMMSVRMLKEKYKDEQSQKLLTILEKNSQRGANLINQILSFSRGVEGERNPIQIKHIISEIEKIAKETFPRNIETKTDIPKDLFTISGDATQLHQVLMNLCVNARDAMPDGGILSITASNFFIDENYAQMHTEAKVGPYVVISISDTGIGIPPKIIDRIFEPFFTTKEVGRGTGLGLSTALAIMKSHGGFINVYSEVGNGTAFRVYLPTVNAEIQNVEEQKLELLVGHGELVLIAEDEESVREVTISTLEKYGYKVLAANDGADAVAMYAQNKNEIKVILMDMMMPVMDGEESIRAIRKINPEIKVIVVSGLAEKDKLAKIESTRAHALLPKPYAAEKLLKTIHEVLNTE